MPHQQIAFRELERSLTASQLASFKSAYSPAVKTQNPEIALPTPKPASGMTVADWITRGDGSTSGVDGLSDQIIAEMGDSLLVRFTHPRFIAGDNCDPYFRIAVCNKLRKALEANPNLKMWCNSAYRSPVRQFVLREFLERRINGITAAAQVGTGNHERGLAIDLRNYIEWQFWLISDGWHWQGENDPMHFDIDMPCDIPAQAIQAYQRLANRHGANLSTDGIWGDATRRSMLSAPSSGW
jgi:hypothetical protein